MDTPSRPAATSTADFRGSGRRNVIRAPSSSPVVRLLAHRLLGDVDQLRVTTREPDFDVAVRQCCRELEPGLGEQVEQPQLQRRTECLRKSAAGLGRLLSAEVCCGGVGLHGRDVVSQLHGGIMTSF